ncbi:CD276 antigen-like isoform 2-T2 [Syngnathus typhle]
MGGDDKLTHKLQMIWSKGFILQLLFQPCLQGIRNVLLTVNAERVSYSAQMGGEVLMGCHFYPLSPYPYEDLIVAWSWRFRASIHLVSFLESGLELDSSQHPDFKGRARLLTEEIKDGRAVLQLSRLRINDSGNYQCMVRTRNGVNSKDIKLSVTAPYKTVTKTISKTVTGGKLVLSCQSEGYPMSTVAWEDGHRRNLNANTSVVTTEEGLYRITSGIQVGSSQKNNYTCRFDSSSTSATFLIPDETQKPKENTNTAVVISTCIVIVFTIVLVIVLILWWPKGHSGKEQNISREQREEEDISIFTEGRAPPVNVGTGHGKKCQFVRRRRSHTEDKLTHKLQMIWSKVFILQLLFQPCLEGIGNVLTVNAERVSYSAQMGGEVLMGCHFYPLSPYPYEDLIVAWSWRFRASIHLVSFLESGLELDSSQHPDFKGRARLLTEEIKDGRAVLQLSRLRIKDSGNYECMVRTRNGADYKHIQLSVTAPYKTVTKTISKTVTGGKLVLSCQSEGYPMSTVAWEDGHRRNLNANTSVVTTEEGLYRITSGIQVGSSQKNNYTCRFDSSSTSATFLVPDETQKPEENTNTAVVIGTCIGIVLVLVIVLILYWHKGHSGKEQNISREQREEEDISIFTEDN